MLKNYYLLIISKHNSSPRSSLTGTYFCRNRAVTIMDGAVAAILTRLAKGKAATEATELQTAYQHG